MHLFILLVFVLLFSNSCVFVVVDGLQPGFPPSFSKGRISSSHQQQQHSRFRRSKFNALFAAAAEEEDEGKKGFNARWQKPLIAPQDAKDSTQAKMKSWREKQGMKSENRQRLDLNWRSGRCKHKVAFEGADVIRRVRFCGDLLAFGLIDGRVCMIRMSTGEILEKYRHHEHEVSSIDFDGVTLCSGSSFGETVIYKLNYARPSQDVMSSSSTNTASSTTITSSSGGSSSGSSSSSGKFSSGNPNSGDIRGSNSSSSSGSSSSSSSSSGSSGNNGAGGRSTFGEFVYKFKMHSRAVTAVKIIRLFHKDRRTQTTTESALMVSCGMDKRLVAVNVESGELVYQQELDAAPLCLGVSGRYLALGMIDGRVLFCNAHTGQIILQFQAHRNRVRSLYFQSDTVLVTGSSKGVVKRWDLSGTADSTSSDSSTDEDGEEDEKKKQTESTVAVVSQPIVGANKPSSNINTTLTNSKQSPATAAASNVSNNSSNGSYTGSKLYKPTRFLDYYFQSVRSSESSSHSSRIKRFTEASSRSRTLSTKPGSTADRLMKKLIAEEGAVTTTTTTTTTTPASTIATTPTNAITTTSSAISTTDADISNATAAISNRSSSIYSEEQSLESSSLSSGEDVATAVAGALTETLAAGDSNDDDDNVEFEIVYETQYDPNEEEEDDDDDSTDDDDDDGKYEIIYETYDTEGEYYYSAAIDEAAGNTGSKRVVRLAATDDDYDNDEEDDDEDGDDNDYDDDYDEEEDSDDNEDDDDDEYEVIEYIIEEDGTEKQYNRKRRLPKIRSTQEWENDDPSPMDKRVKLFHRETIDAAVPVVSVQSDDEKIIAAYEDGTIVSWDVITGEVNFELQGRSNLISNVQFDASRLVADGTNEVLVIHDFSDPPAKPDDLRYDLRANKKRQRRGNDDDSESGDDNS